VNALAKLAGFAAMLVVVFGVAVAAGSAVGPDRDGAAEPSHVEEMGGMDEHAAADPIRGLAASEEGLTLALDRTSLPRDEPTELAFAINAKNGPVEDFEVTHEKRMHLIVVRRDGTGFQHLHPELGDDGTWRTSVTLPDAGAYRVYADFQRGGEAHTLAADLTVDGEATYAPFPRPSTTDTTDGYKVDLKPNGHELDFQITKDGKPVKTEPYLGAGGHLVALREGDLAFLHVHPNDDGVNFEAELEPESRYHLYLQFQHDGRVHTAEFTR
jgi:hypothetical protein